MPAPGQEEAEEEDGEQGKRKRRRRDDEAASFAEAAQQAAGEILEEATSFAYGVVQHFQRPVINLCLHSVSAIRSAALRLLDRVAESGALQPSLYVTTLLAAQIDPNAGCRRSARILLAHHANGPAAPAFKGHFANGISRAAALMRDFVECLPPQQRCDKATREGVAAVYDIAKDARAVRNRFIDGVGGREMNTHCAAPRRVPL